MYYIIQWTEDTVGPVHTEFCQNKALMKGRLRIILELTKTIPDIKSFKDENRAMEYFNEILPDLITSNRIK